MRKLLLLLVCLISPAIAQTTPEGIGQGYDGELKHVASQLLALAEATPADKFAWRPSPGVRSTSEVYMHIAVANFYFLSVVGKQTMPSEIKTGFEKSVTAQVVETRIVPRVEHCATAQLLWTTVDEFSFAHNLQSVNYH